MPRTRRRFNRKRLLLILAATSVIAMLLPRQVTAPLVNLVQVVLPLQHWSTGTADATQDAAGRMGGPKITPEQWESLQNENSALTHQLAALADRLHGLERDYDTLANIRRRGLESGRLIPGKVIGADAMPLRESRLISAGRLAGVRAGATVASNHFTMDLRDTEGLRDGLSVLAGEALVGFVEQVGTHSARVRLLTDRETQLSVILARLIDGKYSPLEAEFWMVGMGPGSPGLEVRDVDHRYIKSEAIMVGDLVLTAGADVRLPASFNVGTVTRIRADTSNSLLYVLEVTPAVDLNDLRRVFVVDPYGSP